MYTNIYIYTYFYNCGSILGHEGMGREEKNDGVEQHQNTLSLIGEDGIRKPTYSC
jgi:hypothetical protein